MIVSFAVSPGGPGQVEPGRLPVRAFLAVPLPAAVQEALGRFVGRLQSRCGPGKWVAEQNYHLTIKFLGNLDEALLQRLLPLLQEVGHLATPAEATLGRLGSFGRPGRARVLWIGAEEGRESLVALHGAIEERLGSAHIVGPDRQPFSPHVTLARARTRQPLVFERGLLETQVPAEVTRPFPVAQLTLFGSELTAAGPVYTTLSQVPLGT